RGLEIVSAAPSLQERELAPHHLYGVLSPQESANAGSYMRLAEPVIDEIKSRGKTPIVTGGSGLYLKFLTHGPAPLPSGDEKLRAELDTRSLDDLVAQLRALDPLEASRTDLQNRRYVERALEVCLITGEKISKLRDQWEQKTRKVSQHLRGIEIRALIAGEIDRATCEELINAATRQYAKRQETWFRRETWLTPIEA
ncbi:MAG: tRNA dimethylallyltransferase, partial [Verrucomicrobia bacterium]|nr:tRNA dimethylallyltransferase [Verrucomicrobiota bacterium]